MPTIQRMSRADLTSRICTDSSSLNLPSSSSRSGRPNAAPTPKERSLIFHKFELMIVVFEKGTFFAPLSPRTFANFVAHSSPHTSTHLLRLAIIAYPHWCERCLEAGAKRIIPAVNLDETDIGNKPCICFRRREIKVVRKTSFYVTFLDKLIRFRNSLATAFEIANEAVAREAQKKRTRKGEMLLDDKDPVTKKPKGEPRMGLKLRTAEATPHLELLVRPKEHAAASLQQIDCDVAKLKEKGHGCWDDQVEAPLQSQFTLLSQRHSENSPSSEEDSPPCP
ncbi:hypothetical protein BJ322DRAFT_1112658 [Thelephora terrestris]|uniref:Uncharacterized protein n=1 Tax=Thelephora terrestris TaxID=56493 RepID=A0A9P6H7E8_9AGAM|nr:hypothetical protein BJ322DRAFT_1112658 [Thelephora terrestris]